MSLTPVGIVGFSGYSGAELVALLSRHPHVEPILMEHREGGDRPRPLGHDGPRRLPCSANSVRSAGLAAIFFATPPEVSMELAGPMLDAGAKVIDLSGAFRLGTAENYQRWYKAPHTQPELLKEAVYGLPEFCRGRVATARLISNPGCYPTAANLAIKPLIEAGAIDREQGIVCDAKSGVSGAGRKASLKTSFCEVTENFSAYSILDHRHVPEVLRTSGLDEAEFSFTAQLIPIHRGILETIYFRASGKIVSADDLLAIYSARYASEPAPEPFVRLYAAGQVPDLHSVAHTNFCDIGFKYDQNTRRVVVISVIDNLVKGAAGQAIQNMNLALGYPETAGLL
jgi:N-acetyl-gamma-glutamyl-phosphate reductase